MKRCILLSCPCLHVRSLPSCAYAAPPPDLAELAPCAQYVSTCRCRPVASVEASPLRPHAAHLPGVLRALRRSLQAQRPALRRGLRRTFTPAGLPPQLRCVLEVSHLLDAFFRTCRPALFHAGIVLGLPSLRRFLPACSPENLSAPGVLLAVSPARAGPAPRMSASPGCVDIASRV